MSSAELESELLLELFGRQMEPEVHGGVEDANHFQSVFAGAEQKDVATLGGDAATGEKLVPKSIAKRIIADGYDRGSKPFQVELFLLGSPGFEGVVADGSEVVESGLGEDELHASPRTRSLKCCLDWILTVWPDSS